ncbi:MAG: aminotransferase class V-fold PLP-dependent enzyme [Oscillospiraceae bacterium]|nr:aminotransferase class V-fold PLP-dependent enzyme [Oscillospiraceae bacterium]
MNNHAGRSNLNVPPAPLLNTLQAHADSKPILFHMPGHKGSIAIDAVLDVTELPFSGDLYRDTWGSDSPIRQAEALWANDFNTKYALFLTNGATQGIQAALYAMTTRSDTIILDECAHTAFGHVMTLLGLRAIVLPRDGGRISSVGLDKLLAAHPNCKLVCVTSPTYYGICCDIPALANVAHSHGTKLFVDAAHGAHFPYAGLGFPAENADCFVVSAHKTLRALGQSAVLFCQNDALYDTLRETTKIFGTSSPSYLLMASLDMARFHADTHRADWQTLVLNMQNAKYGVQNDDPTRLVAPVECGEMTAKTLREHYNFWVEAYDAQHIICIVTPGDDLAALDALQQCNIKATENRIKNVTHFPHSLPIHEEELL